MTTFPQLRSSIFLLPALLLLAGCHGQPGAPGMKVGKPYMVAGKTYYPEYDPTYDKIGMASWYGPGFHGKYTASGEIYNQNDLTAAHPTLPMPSLVRVTNLSNGKSLIVRINDRGPFKSNRIIDLSKKAASELGIPSTSEVRVQILKKETDEYLASIGNGGQDMTSVNAQAARERESSVINSTEPSDQIVESTNSRSGQVSDAAPVMTVSSGDLAAPSGSKLQSSDTPAAKPVVLSRNEAANDDGDDNVPQTAKPQTMPFKPQVVKTTFETPSEEPRKGKIEMSGVQSGAFYIQAGSFASEENAHKLSGKLDGVAKIDVGKVEMGDRTWWRVRLGPFSTKAEASSALDQVHASGVPDARIVNQ